jgi:hypothetical protein
LPFHPYLHIDDKGLFLGAGTLIASMIADELSAPVLAIDGEEERILALLSLAFRKPIPIVALKFVKRASAQWAKGERALAHFELAYARLPRFETREDARALFYADELVKLGVSPRALMLSRDIDTSQLDFLKYNADELRVPPGSGRESGRWTSGDGDAAQSPDASSGGSSGEVISDVSPDPIRPGQQYAQERPRYPGEPRLLTPWEAGGAAAEAALSMEVSKTGGRGIGRSAPTDRDLS